ncbi:ankyrin repeat domain-containing protein, partial [Candidatus Bathyarchaeota archaeon]|nr:ankyrin repeat domain-containing protein [Candidatus Bathyarchaeota archaeon]
TTLLLDHGAAIDATDKTGWTPLDIACMWGKLAAAEALLQHRAFRECARTDWQGSPVVIAADLGYYGVAEVFLRHGFDPNIPGADGATALWHAVRTKRLDVCRLLLDSKADPDLTPDGATPPLIEAVKATNLDIVKLLVEQGADIEKKEVSENTWRRTPCKSFRLPNTNKDI